MSVPRFLNLSEAAALLGGNRNGWLSELLEAVERKELKVTISGYAQEWTDRVATEDLRAYLVRYHGADLLAKKEEPIVQRPIPTVSESKAIQVIAALLAAWPGGKIPAAKDLEKAAHAVGISVSDDTIRKALKAAQEIATGIPSA